MKKLTTMICAAVISAGMTMGTIAAPSIGQLIPEAPQVMSGEFQDGYELAVQNVSTKGYANKDVADIVEKFNDDNSTLTVVDVLKALDPELDLTKDEIRTTKGHQIDPSEYEAIMPFVDLVLTKGTDVTYEMDLKEETETEAETEAETDQDVDPAAIVKEGVTVSFKLEPAKDLEKDDLLIMQIDQKTGKVYFIEIDKYDPKTGEITAKFPCLGPFAVLTKGEAAAK